MYDEPEDKIVIEDEEDREALSKDKKNDIEEHSSDWCKTKASEKHDTPQGTIKRSGPEANVRL